MEITKWLICPICGNKTRDKIQEDAVLRNFPLFCPKYKQENDRPALVKKIGKTTYRVHIHFSTTSTETMRDKIKRMLKNEIQQM